MENAEAIAVVDIGKSNAKVVVVDAATGAETASRRTPNRVVTSGPYPHYDTDALRDFISDALGEIGRGASALVVTTHGAAGALVRDDGELALPVLDYEHDGPDSLASDYEAVRPDFAETGSPRLPVGLNLGAQLFWQARRFPDAFASARHFLTWPQYWAWRLTGIAAVEATSLGAHTDLWSPFRKSYSSLVRGQGWDRLMPRLHRAADRLGPLSDEVARRTGLPAGLPVFCGIHDSNASLYPHLVAREAPFAVVSTGTWVIVMAVGGETKPLDPERDTLVNVNAFGDPVPSARFMGGREFAMLLGDAPEPAGEADIARVLAEGVILTPSTEQGNGPFRGRSARWLPSEPTEPRVRFAAVSFYLAMMAATCLDLAGARGDVVVEGPFGSNDCFVRMLASATGRPVRVPRGSTGTSVGAAMLCGMKPVGDLLASEAVHHAEAALAAYAARWRRVVASDDAVMG
jgi:Sugar (pentulose and hexulose) kinases